MAWVWIGIWDNILKVVKAINTKLHLLLRSHESITLLHQELFELLLAQIPANQHPFFSAVVSATQTANPVDLLYELGWNLPMFPKTCWIPTRGQEKKDKRKRKEQGRKRSWCWSVLKSQKDEVEKHRSRQEAIIHSPTGKHFGLSFIRICDLRIFWKLILHAVSPNKGMLWWLAQLF